MYFQILFTNFYFAIKYGRLSRCLLCTLRFSFTGANYVLRFRAKTDTWIVIRIYIFRFFIYIIHTWEEAYRRIILIELVIWKLKLLIRTNRIDNYEASNTREFPWTVLQRHVTSHRERSFDIHAIFTLVSVVRVRNIAISINVLNFFSRPPRDLLLTFAIGFPEDSHSSPLLTSTLYTNTIVRRSVRSYETTQASSLPRRFCFLLVHVFFAIIYYTNSIRHRICCFFR